MTAAITEQPIIGEQRIKMSYEEYLAWPDQGNLTEWVDGELVILMPPKDLHQAMVGFIYRLIAQFVDLLKLGAVRVAPLEMRVHPAANAREPDVLFIAGQHIERLMAERLAGPADLAIEVISDESIHRDRVDKFYEYQEGGVREYWIIDPRPGKERVDGYWLTPQGRYQAILPDDDGRYHSTVLPDFWFHPDWLWQEPKPDPLLMLAEIAPQALRSALAGKLGL
jgi:Uma2 family endonuclease